MSLHACTLGSFYWVADMTYDKNVLKHDKEKSWPFIVRTNVEREGYLSFLLPLLFNSTYSLIIDSTQLKEAIPNVDWIDKAIMEKRNNPRIIPVCGLHKKSNVAKGCMLVKSVDLRTIWTRTTLRRTHTSAMEVFSHLFHCLFNYTFIDSVIPKPIMWRGESSTIGNKRDENRPKLFHCDAGYKNDGSVGIILPQFKRMRLDQQLVSLKGANEIIVVQDAQHQDYHSILEKWSGVKHIWTTNWDSPFFLRFLVTMELRTYYIHNIDDDIVFGNTTLETLNRMIDATNSTVGIMGRRVRESNFLKGSFSQSVVRGVGDFLCNSYAGTMDTMKVFWRYRPYTQNNGEDIHYSLSNLLECGRRVRILPYDRLSDHFTDYGRDNVSTCGKANHFPLRGRILRSWVMRGVDFWNGSVTYDSYPESITDFHMDYLREAYYMMP